MRHVYVVSSMLWGVVEFVALQRSRYQTRRIRR